MQPIKRTPLPLAKTIVLASILLCNSLINTVLLPFIAFMVADFKTSGEPWIDIPKYSGYLLSSFMMGQLLFSYPWGLLSDKIGRRPILLVGLVLTTSNCLAFGLSSSYTMAILLRFSTGIIGVSKTYLAEITDQTNQSLGFSILGLTRAMGLIIGPIIGGFLSNPAKKYPLLFPKGSFFDRYPYSLPTVIVSCVSLIGTVLAFFILEETLFRPTPISLIDPDLFEPQNSNDILGIKATSVLSTQSTSYDNSIEFEEDEDEEYFDSRQSRSEEERRPLIDVESSLPPPSFINTSSVFSLLKDKSISQVLILYGCISSYYIVYDESFVLWARESKQNGGIGWETSEIGTAFSVGGIVLLFYQGLLYSRIERRIGSLRAFQIGILMTIPSYILLPRARFFFTGSDARHFNEDTFWVWISVFFCQALRSISSLQAFTSCFIMIANCTPAGARGGINGLAQSVGSLFQMLGPIVGGYLFSFSIKNKDYLGVDFVFNLMVCCAAFTWLVSLRTPASVIHRRTD